ncbi:hypothetical protein Tsubulata_025501 [Turnera subulata]|uniref:Uncharacterized protein n=1 Tax=Turnera subulata TaxID=218843 RepID=A0A9Q0FIM8_9ROSI|nr:hypothetical protein Tsubulata_025501 [Turnera subulata]
MTLSTEGKSDCLIASGEDKTSREVKLRLEEYVESRRIYNVRYHFEDAKYYDKKIVLVAENSWKYTHGIKLGVTEKLEAKIPVGLNSRRSIISHTSQGRLMIDRKRLNPVTLFMCQKIASCDIPFSYSQTDTLYDGSQVTSDNVKGGLYHVDQCYLFNYRKEYEEIKA